MIFADRADAAKALIPHLKKYKNNRVVVLAIPRGGVTLGYEIANYFGWPLSLMLTKKIGHPANKEYAIGAVSLYHIISNNIHPDVPQSYIQSEAQRIRNDLMRYHNKIIGARQVEPVKGKVVIIVDDGIATGFTMRASIEAIKSQKPSKIVVAVPVASPRIVSSLRGMVDDFIALETPPDFSGVGQFYQDFSEVTDEEVLEKLSSLKL